MLNKDVPSNLEEQEDRPFNDLEPEDSLVNVHHQPLAGVDIAQIAVECTLS